MHYTILCTSCNAIRSYQRQDDTQFPDAQVLAQAGHSEDCAIQQAGTGTVTVDTSNPDNTLYSIA